MINLVCITSKHVLHINVLPAFICLTVIWIPSLIWEFTIFDLFESKQIFQKVHFCVQWPFFYNFKTWLDVSKTKIQTNNTAVISNGTKWSLSNRKPNSEQMSAFVWQEKKDHLKWNMRREDETFRDLHHHQCLCHMFNRL